MRPAVVAQHFRANHKQAEIALLGDRTFANGRVEARPARARVELRLGREERRTAANAGVRACGLTVVEATGESAFGSFFASNAELLFGKLLAPFCFRFLYFRHGLFLQSVDVFAGFFGGKRAKA